MKWILLFLIIEVFSSSSYCQKVIISGKEGLRKLKWEDFKGKVDESSPYGALTSYNYKYSFDGAQVIGDSLKIKNFQFVLELDSVKSWAKMDTVDDELLVHEQGHFDIGVMFMNEFLMKYNETKWNKATFNDDLKKMYTEMADKYEKMGVEYDKETDHSRNAKEQAKWNKLFDKNVSFDE
jgi:hypothetical protein